MIINILVIQLGLLITLFIFAFFIYQKQTWRLTFLRAKDALTLTTQVGLLIWSLISIIVGLFYLTISAPKHFLIHSVIVLGFPFCTLTFLVVRIVLNNVQSKREVNELSKKNEQLLNWVSSFSFIDKNKVHLSLYTSKGKTVGRVIIIDVDKEQAQKLKDRKRELPQNISLDIIINDDGNDNVLH